MRFTLALIGCAASSMALAEVTSHFVSAIQFSVQEPTPELMRRSQALVRTKFAENVDLMPELKARSFEVRTIGNEVVFYLVTQEDTRAPMQQVVSSLVEHLRGRVRAGGRASFYRAALSQPMGGYLETVVNDDHTAVLSLSARSVSLRDLLRQLKTQMTSVNYVIPGDCADQTVDWTFGKREKAEPKTMETILAELATHFDLKLESRNGTHALTGNCRHNPQVATLGFLGAEEDAPLNDPSAPGLFPVAFTTQPHVYVPITPLGE